MSIFTPVGGERVANTALAASDRKIDYDRGVIIKLIKDLGMEVFMYKREPGVYYSQHGTVVPDALAAKAGYDIEYLGRLRKHQNMVAQATEAYARQLDVDTGKATRQIVAERDGFQVVLLGGVRHAVLSPDGLELTKGMPLTEKVALDLLNDLAPPPKQEVPAGLGDGGRGRGQPDGMRNGTAKVSA